MMLSSFIHVWYWKTNCDTNCDKQAILPMWPSFFLGEQTFTLDVFCICSKSGVYGHNLETLLIIIHDMDFSIPAWGVEHTDVKNNC